MYRGGDGEEGPLYVTPGMSYCTWRERESSARIPNGMHQKKKAQLGICPFCCAFIFPEGQVFWVKS